METTLAAIRTFQPCADGWARLLRRVRKTRADDAPLSFATILESNGLDHAVWCLRVIGKTHRQEILNFACDCAASVLPIYEAAYPHDPRPHTALSAARRGVSDRAAEEGTWCAPGTLTARATWAARAVWAATEAARAPLDAPCELVESVEVVVKWAAAAGAHRAAQIALFTQHFCTRGLGS